MSSSPSIPFLRESAAGDASQAVACGIKLDLSRQRLTHGDLEGLFKFAAEKDLLGAHARMIRGECVNGSEGRPALHTSLRAFSLSAPRYAEVSQERRRLFEFAQRVRDGRWLGCRGDRIVDVINIGIGGSEMGPKAVWHALQTASPDIPFSYFYYACKHRRLVDGHKCGYRKQWSEEKINNAVEEVIRKLVKNPKFEEAILNKIGSRIDTEEIEKEIERLEKQHRQLTGAKGRLGQQMDSLDIMDKFYEKKYQDMETRLYRLYDEIEGVENSIEEVKNRLLNIRQQKISEENVYQFLLYFDKLYDKFTDLEKKEFLNSFVEQVDIYEQEQPDGRFLKHIKFRFPVYFGDRETQELCWDNESTVETVCLLGKRKPDAKVKIGIDMDDYYRIRENAESK